MKLTLRLLFATAISVTTITPAFSGKLNFSSPTIIGALDAIEDDKKRELITKLTIELTTEKYEQASNSADQKECDEGQALIISTLDDMVYNPVPRYKNGRMYLTDPVDTCDLLARRASRAIAYLPIFQDFPVQHQSHIVCAMLEANMSDSSLDAYVKAVCAYGASVFTCNDLAYNNQNLIAALFMNGKRSIVEVKALCLALTELEWSHLYTTEDVQKHNFGAQVYLSFIESGRKMTELMPFLKVVLDQNSLIFSPANLQKAFELIPQFVKQGKTVGEFVFAVTGVPVIQRRPLKRKNDEDMHQVKKAKPNYVITGQLNFATPKITAALSQITDPYVHECIKKSVVKLITPKYDNPPHQEAKALHDQAQIRIIETLVTIAEKIELMSGDRAHAFVAFNKRVMRAAKYLPYLYAFTLREEAAIVCALLESTKEDDELESYFQAILAYGSTVFHQPNLRGKNTHLMSLLLVAHQVPVDQIKQLCTALCFLARSHIYASGNEQKELIALQFYTSFLESGRHVEDIYPFLNLLLNRNHRIFSLENIEAAGALISDFVFENGRGQDFLKTVETYVETREASQFEEDLMKLS